MKKEWELIKNIYGCTTILMQETEAKETENAFKVVEKSLKALEIIKEKNVDVDYFLFWSKQGNLGKVEDYNDLLKHKNGRCQRLPLTEEEFDLLKEVLE